MSLVAYNRHRTLGLGVSTNLMDYGKINPNQLGLGLKLFGKKITLGSVAKGLVNRLVGFAASAVEVAVPGVGHDIANVMRDYGKQLAELVGNHVDSWLNGPDTAYELTYSEEQIIKEWYPKFEAFVESLIKETGAALKLVDQNSLVTGLNAVLNKINAVQDHYIVTQTPGLSQQALDQRNYLIYEGLKVVHYALTEGVASLKDTTNLTSVQITFPINAYDFRPLFSSTIVTTVTGENYKVATGGTTKTPSLPVKNPSIPTNGGIKTGVITKPGSGDGGIIPAVPVNTGSTPTGSIPTKQGDKGTVTDSQSTETETTTTGGTTVNKSSNTKKYVIGGLALLAVAVAAKAMSKKKPAKRKASGKSK